MVLPTPARSCLHLLQVLRKLKLTFLQYLQNQSPTFSRWLLPFLDLPLERRVFWMVIIFFSRSIESTFTGVGTKS